MNKSHLDHSVYKEDDIAVIGIGLQIAGAGSLDEYWSIFENNIDLIRDLPQGRQADLEEMSYIYSLMMPNPNGTISYNKAGYLERIDEFDYEFFKLPPIEAQVMDPIQRILLQTVYSAFDDAGYTPDMLSGSKTGIFIGYTPGSTKDNYSTNIFHNNPELIKYSNVGNMPCMVPSRASFLLNLKGPTMVIDSACSSSLVAIHDACASIKNGTCTMAIAGGIRLHSFPIAYDDMNVGFETDDNKTRTFDNAASGAAIGEGSAVVLLKPLRAAEQDKDHIYAVIKSTAINNDGSSASITAPNPAAQAAVILEALQASGLSPEEIDYVETHGTATALGDPIEFRGLTSAYEKFTDKKQFCGLSSSKSNIGHLYEAAGVASFIKALAAIKNKKIPGASHFNIPNLKIDFCDSPFYINNTMKSWDKDGLRACGVSAFGISGTNCHVIVQEYVQKDDEWKLPGGHILGISAKSQESLTALFASYKQYVENTDVDVNLFAANANLYRAHHARRLAVIYDDRDHLIHILNRLVNSEPGEWEHIPGVYYNFENLSKEMDYSQIRATLKRCNGSIIDSVYEEIKSDLEYLADVYSCGAKLDWASLYNGIKPRHLSIPHYPFKRTRCWLPKKEKQRDWNELSDKLTLRSKGSEAMSSPVAVPAVTHENMFYKRVFVEAEPIVKNTGLGRCLFIHQQAEPMESLYDSLQQRFFEVEKIAVDAGEAKRIGLEKYFAQLYREIAFKDISHIVIADLLGDQDNSSPEQRLHMHNVQLLSIVGLYREFANYENAIKVAPILSSCFQVTGEEAQLNPNGSPVFGLCKSFNRMFKNIASCCIDTDAATGWTTIADEICAVSRKDIVAYRSNKRFYEGLHEMDIEADSKAAVIKNGGVYFISGGLGGIGFETAMEMTARAKQLSLILVGRTPLPPQSEWDAIMRSDPQSDMAEKIERLRLLQAKAGSVEYYALDIGDADAVQSAVRAVNAKYGRLNGIVHGAGISGGITFEQLNEEHFTNILKPKIIGTYILDQATRDQKLDFFLMFSSISTIFSSADLPGYIAGNIFLDCYSDYRSKVSGSRSITVNWATWSEIGMAVKSNFTIDTLFQTIKTKEAIGALFSVLQSGGGSVVIARLNLKDKISLLLKTYPLQLSAGILEALQAVANENAGPAASNPAASGEDYANVEEALLKLCCQHLGYEEINVHHNFFELGANSILLSIIYKDLNEMFPGILQVTDLFSYPTVSLLAEHISNKRVQDGAAARPERMESLESANLMRIAANEPAIAASAFTVAAPAAPDSRASVFTAPAAENTNVVPFPAAQSSPAQASSREGGLTDNDDDSVAIIGVGMDLPGCKDLDSYWEMLINGINIVRDIPSERAVDITNHLRARDYSEDQIRFRRCGYLDEVNKFDHAFFGISPRDAALLDPVTRIFLQCCSNAIDDSGYGADGVKGTNTGIFLGYTANLGNAYNRLLFEVDPKLFNDALPIGQVSMTASRTAYVFDLKGPSMVIDTACSSSLVALHMACEQIRFGKCEMALAGGASLMAIPLADGTGVGFESPEEKTRAFSDQASGASIAEGVGVVLLKSLKQAQKDGDSIYAVIKGSAINQDGSSFGIAAPNYLAQSEAIQLAWADAGVTAGDISYIEAHGTGTQLGDPIEIRGIHHAFQTVTDGKQICGIGSVKTNIGHANEAAGMCGLFKCMLTLQNGVIPPTLHFQAPNPNIDFIHSPLYIVDKATPLKAKGEKAIIGISGFGMSGTNAHLILEEAPKAVSAQKSGGKQPLIFTVSARTEEALFQLIDQYRNYLLAHKNVNLADLACTLNIGRKHYSHRLAFIYRNQSELLNRLSELLRHRSLDEIRSDWCYAGHYSLVPESKKEKYPHEMTSKEQQRLSDEARVHCEQADKLTDAGLQAIMASYVKGATIAWRALYSEPYLKLHLPTYPYARHHAWYQLPAKAKTVNTEENRESLFDHFFHHTRWIAQDKPAVNLPSTGEICVVVHSDSRGKHPLSQRLKERGVRVVDVFAAADSFDKADENTYRIASSAEHFQQLFTELSGHTISRIVHVGACRDDEVTSAEQMYGQFEYGFFSVVHLVKGLVKARLDQKISLVIAASNAYTISGQERRIQPHNATVLSLGQIIEQENATISCRAIDTDMETSADQLADQIFAEHNMYLVGLRQGQSYMKEFDAAEVKPEADNRIVDGGTYIITGGTSGIGVQNAKLFSKQANCNLILLSRKGFPDEDLWGDCEEMDAYKETIKDFKEIRSSGSKLEFMKCDISNAEDVRSMLDFVRAKYKKINGIVHCAGVIEPSFILRKEKSSYLSVFAPKVLGTWNLDQFTRQDQLDFVLLHSSNVTDAGEPGQSCYMAANAFLDSYTDYLNAQGINTYTVNWVAWKETGMAYKQGTNVDTTTKAITNREATNALNQLLRSKPQRVVIGQFSEKADMVSLLKHSRNAVASGFKSKISKYAYNIQVDEVAATTNAVAVLAPPPVQEESPAASPVKEAKLTGNVEGEYTAVEQQIGNIYCAILGYEEADIYEGFFDMGGDSILLTEMHDTINKLYPNIVKIADLFEFDSIQSLAAYISSRIEKLENIKKAEMAESAVKVAEAEEKTRPEPDIDSKEQPAAACYELSNPQERIYVDYRYARNKHVYNIGFVSDRSGDSYESLVENANLFFNRFDMLRTTFEMVDKKLMQVVHPMKPIEIERVKVASVAEIDYTKYVKTFKLSEYPLFNLTLFEAPDRKLLFFDVHHILLDGYSTTVFQEHMEAFGTNTVPANPLYPYSKYVEFEKTFYSSDEYKAMGSYWKNQLEGFDFTNPLTSKDGDAEAYGHTSIELNPELADRVLKFAKARKTTVFSIFLGAYALTLAALTQRNDISILTPALNRYLPEFKHSIGVFTNLIPLRVDAQSGQSLTEYIKKVTKVTIGGVENQFYQYNHLIRDLKSAGPEFFFYMDFEDNSLKKFRSTDDIPYAINIPKFALDVEIKNFNNIYHVAASYKKSDVSDEEAAAVLDRLVKNLANFCNDNLNQSLDSFIAH